MPTKADRAWADYGERFRREVFPKLLQSAMMIHIHNGGPGEMPDIKAATELGMALLLGKPLVILRVPGVEVPPALAGLSREVLDWDPHSEDAQEKLADVLRGIVLE